MSEQTNILEAIAIHVQQCPESIALVHENWQMSYAELDSYSSAIAEKLQALSVLHGDSVALCLDRSIHAIAAMLGVWKVGGVFVPLDPNYPSERLSFMLEDTAAHCVLAAPVYADLFKIEGVHVELLTDSMANLSAEFTPTASIEPNDRAYVMYTSGSTGKPKGVPISHRALMNYCEADAAIYELMPEDRTLQFATLCFDIAIEEIFPPLLVGSTVVVRPKQYSSAQIELSEIVDQYKITALHLATGYWHEWVDLMNAANMRIAESLRLMVVTGEKVSPEHYKTWQSLEDKPVLWANAYGPTEATVTATVFIPPENWSGAALPIGKPLLNYTTYVLNEERQPLEAGETGELYIGGPSLAEGYLNRPDLTDKAFFPDPFSSEDNARMYRTGDLARFMDDGNIDYAGRVDHQIKVGSFRIEPGEIENVILEHEDVKEVLVVADESGGKKKLLAYIASDTKPVLSDLVDFQRSRLPKHMTPRRYILLPALPKTVNGKIDRKALPDGSEAESPRSKDHQEPQGKVQIQLCKIWSDVLSIPEVSVNDSFVSLGGDSLMAVRVLARIQKDLDFTISTRDFFYLDTVALLAGYIEGKAIERVTPAPIPHFITSRNRQIYTLTQPKNVNAENGSGVLVVPPLGNEQRRTQRPFKVFMNNLARRGFTSMRFDWTGTANSSGESVNLSSIEQWCNDLHEAAELLAERCDHIELVALRMGALVAAQTELGTLPIRQRFYWDPVFSGEQWLSEMQTMQQGILNDTFRFLRVRKPLVGDIAEFAGLRLSAAMQNSIRKQNFGVMLRELEWNRQAHLIFPYGAASSQLSDVPCNQYFVEEENDWVGERSTTSDMNINKASSLLVDILENESTPTLSLFDNNIKARVVA